MRCPFCDAADTRVVDTRTINNGTEIRRRRECISCHQRFSTLEEADIRMPLIVKADGSREPFNENKIRVGMLRALEKRPVGVDSIDRAVNAIKSRLRASGEREIKSRDLGGFVMDELFRLDSVAYIRFASVYLSFATIQDFSRAIEAMEKNNKSEDC
ncbi:transcriptional regulator NrdR [Succinimonas amylolytica]|uniref:transcriptional regulator NrdR n=1 Tax=Succinimonas amylolytica TaxID=83769 RepID=UPI00037A4C7C|nr:transcriptional regulator NrdR [Succinimonas amylolytica]